MMKFPSRLRKQSSYASLLWSESETIRGVRYAIRRVSLSQRIELTKKARELSLCAWGSVFMSLPKVGDYGTESVFSGAVRILEGVWWNEYLVCRSEDG
jgi:hypothetical protein